MLLTKRDRGKVVRVEYPNGETEDCLLLKVAKNHHHLCMDQSLNVFGLNSLMKITMVGGQVWPSAPVLRER